MSAPKGNKFAVNAKQAQRALERALELRSGIEPQYPMVEKFSVLVAIWDAQIDMALEGDKQSASMIMDRLDGKPAIAVSGSIDHDHRHEHNHKSVSETADWIEGIIGVGQEGLPKNPVSH